MGCEFVKLDGMEGFAVLCGGKRRSFCQFCQKRPATKLCDFVVGKQAKIERGMQRRVDKTCDASMCAVCATDVGKNLDYCPKHKAEAKQGGLF